MANSIKKKQLVCADCGKKYKGTLGLAIHRAAAHKVKDIALEECNVKCDQCDRIFYSKVGLATHLRRAHLERAYLKKYKEERTAQIESKGNTNISISGSNDFKKDKELEHAFSIGVTIGTIKEYCRNVAEKYGYSTVEFTSSIADVLYRETRR